MAERLMAEYAGTERLKAFTLKCSECGAPAKNTSDPRCSYCGVVLMWAPVRSLSRDDGRGFGADVEDEPDCKLLPFASSVASSGQTLTLEIRPLELCRPTHLWIKPAHASNFQVQVFRIGLNMDIIGNANPADGELFSRGRGFPIANAESIMPGVNVSLTVENMTVCTQSFYAALRVRVVPRDWQSHVPHASLRHAGVSGTWLDRDLVGERLRTAR